MNLPLQIRWLIRFGTLAFSLPLAPVAASPARAFPENLDTFFEAHCYECHDDLASKGELDLYALSSDLTNPAVFETWNRIYDRVASGEMPPKDQPVPSTGEKRIFHDNLAPALTKAHAASKGTVLRRLNRREYENTLNDLLGIRESLASNLPEDGRSNEFDTVGESLGFSLVQMQQYLLSADQALEAAIEDTLSAPLPTSKTASYADGREAERFLGKNWLHAPDGSVVFFHAPGYPTGMLREANADRGGFHRIRITGYAYQSNKPITFSVGATSFARGSDKPTFGYFSLPPGNAKTIELTAWMDERYMLVITPQGLYDPQRLIREKGIENYRGPGLAIKQVEIEGPIIDEFPSRGHQLIFEGLDRREVEPNNPSTRNKPNYLPEFEIVSESPTEDVIPVLKRFAAAAFRRPASDDDIASYLILFQSELHGGASFEEALKSALIAMLCSTDFLYLKESTGALDDYAIASRLSYFLNRTAPDKPLLASAGRGELVSSRDDLIAHASRLIESDHFERFIVDFTDSWLDLRNIDFTNPDKQLFPEFDRFLQHSMVDETRSFFREIIDENLGIETLVKSDFAMLNWRLAKHYGIDGVESVELERVSLPDETVRGGFLSQGSILKVSANGTNTSPVIRGVWVNERILGKHPAPPPPGIPGVEPDIRGAETLREILDRHRDSENCQACHEMIDPPGFALESFNPIGGYRSYFRSLNTDYEKPSQRWSGDQPIRYRIGPDVDASGILQDGRNFSDFHAFRDLIAEDRDQLAKTFLTKLLTFATGREMGFSDRPEIDRLVKASAENQHRIRDLFLLTVSSEIFRHK